MEEYIEMKSTKDNNLIFCALSMLKYNGKKEIETHFEFSYLPIDVVIHSASSEQFPSYI